MTQQDHDLNTSARMRMCLGIILLLALSTRLIYFSQMLDSPCIDQHRWPQSDMHFFDQWARIIADGDWLTDRSLHPYHQWHDQAASQLSGDTYTQTYGVELWNQWYGGKRFHQEPLYPYMIALTYRMFGHDVRWVFAWQMLCGLISIVLLFRIARRTFGEKAALIVAAIAAMYGPLLFYEMVLLRTTLIAMTGLVLVDLTQIALAGSRRWPWFVLGAAMAMAALLKIVFVLYAAGVMIVLLFRTRQKAAPLAAGFVLFMLPLVARNLAVGAPPFGISSVGAVTFICTNGPWYEPGTGFLGNQTGVAQIMNDTGGRFVPAAIQTLSSHPNIGSYLHQLWGKVCAAVGWYEVPNNTNFYFYQLHAPVLRWMPAGFWMFVPLGVAGVILFMRRTATRPLLLLIIVSIVPLLAFYVLSRFRVTLALALLPFAAMAMVQWIDWVRTGRWKQAVLFVVLTGATALWILNLGPTFQPLMRADDYGATWIAHYRPKVQEAIRNNDIDSAAALMQQLLRFEPAIISELGPNRPAKTDREINFARTFHEFYLTYAVILRQAGQHNASAAAMSHADRLNMTKDERTTK